MGRRIFLLLSLFFPSAACEEVVKLRQFRFRPKRLSQALGDSNSICSRVQFHSLSVEVRFTSQHTLLRVFYVKGWVRSHSAVTEQKTAVQLIML